MTPGELRGWDCSGLLLKAAPRSSNSFASLSRDRKRRASGGLRRQTAHRRTDWKYASRGRKQRVRCPSWISHQDISIWQSPGTFLTGHDMCVDGGAFDLASRPRAACQRSSTPALTEAIARFGAPEGAV